MSWSGDYEKYMATAAAVAGTAMVVRGVVSELVPDELREMLRSAARGIRARVSSTHTVVIDETEGLSTNQIYDAARTYLAARINTDMQRLRASRVDDAQGIMITMDQGEEMLDVHDGVEYTWRLVSRDTAAAATAHAAPYGIGGGGAANRRGRSRFEVKSFEVSFHKKHKEKALRSYLPFVIDTAKAMNDKHRNLKMHMIEYDAWTAVDLRHPSTFDTLAMDHSLKHSVMYDLERLLVGMSNRSILVVEDIDCTIDLQQRDEGEIKRAKPTYSGEENEDKVTLSGLLNFVDGLWSTSGEERIIVFTTNYRERLDPALLRPGRMDMHIHMGYCTREAFRVLASNYHNVENHAMYPEIEQLIEEVLTTPAEVAEVLMRNDDVDVALQVLAEFLKAKRNEPGETKAENKNGNQKINKYEQSMV
ncbi:Os05g0588850 [Oryza sativa Japonica Group]|uniref:Os05g0588850 protein n=1 Tax=Oryza sativa subsp. japonica TaxID=39947 RepID=A0A0P0WRK9_ORYSJ|nr:hypothetical protein EE612_031448 [Oryza sativa]BAS95606.1 Os05g0588850 [Oryza sativa Japonica Group]